MPNEWEFVTDDRWTDEHTAGRMEDLAIQMRAMSAGNATLKFYDDDENLLGMESLSFCDTLEVAVRFDAIDGTATWAWRLGFDAAVAQDLKNRIRGGS